MKKMFKDIRHGDIDAVRASIAKNPAVVNEVFDGKKPLKDIGQSPLQVAVKCGQFEIIDLLIANGADVDFMENPDEQPEDTNDHYFMCMPVLDDAIMGAFSALSYGEFERAEKYVRLVDTLLEKGADPNKATTPHPFTGKISLPLDRVVLEAEQVLRRYSETTYEPHIKKHDEAKKHLFEILDSLIKYGADFEYWADNRTWGDQTCRAAFFEDSVPIEDKPYEIEWRGKVVKGVIMGDKEIRAAMREYYTQYYLQRFPERKA